MELTSKQRAFLRSASNQMETILQIGKSGITDTVVVQGKDALKARELIKIRVLETCPFTPKEAAQALAEATGASVVDRSSASMADGSVISQVLAQLATQTPSITGKILRRCFPVALNPTMVMMPPRVGPFRSPPARWVNHVAARPLIPMFRSTAGIPSCFR